jgi:tRNA pseudouridine38-40 synthase
MSSEPATPTGGGLVRVRLDLGYDGTGFAGWARQPGQRTVQGELEQAVALVLRLPRADLVCAGRTDSGVHARRQVAHVDVPAAALDATTGRSSDAWPAALVRRLNGVLDADVRVRGATAAPAGFDARFAALWRRYAYRLSDRPATADPLLRTQTLWWPRALDVPAMQSAADLLLGEHDFLAYCRPREGASTVRELQHLRCRRDTSGLIVLDVQADAFCHHMVRALTGALVSVGESRRPIRWPAEALAARRRDGSTPVLPSRGLTLEEVGYPADDELALRVDRTRRLRG